MMDVRAFLSVPHSHLILQFSSLISDSLLDCNTLCIVLIFLLLYRMHNSNYKLCPQISMGLISQAYGGPEWSHMQIKNVAAN